MNVVKAAVLLPFTVKENRTDKSNPRMTEYYEGLLLAVDSLKRQGISFDLYTYNTQGSKQVMTSILNKPVMKTMDIIFGPVAPENIPVATEFAKKNDIRLVIPFEPKVDQVFSTPQIYQVNTPQSYLYSEVYEHFIRQFSRCNVIFLDPANGDKEKGRLHHRAEKRTSEQPGDIQADPARQRNRSRQGYRGNGHNPDKHLYPYVGTQLGSHPPASPSYACPPRTSRL